MERTLLHCGVLSKSHIQFETCRHSCATETLVHANRLKPFSESSIPQGGKTQEQGGNTEQEENSPADETERPNNQPDLTVNEDIISRQPDHSIDKNIQPDLSQTEDTINYNSSFVLQMSIQPGVDRRCGRQCDTHTEGHVGVEDIVSIRCVC